MAANLSSAIDKGSELAAIDYSKLKVAVGTLSEPTVISATLTDGVVSIEYKPKPSNKINLPTDELVAIVFTNSDKLWEARQVRGELAVATIAITVEDAVAADVLCLSVCKACGWKQSIEFGICSAGVKQMVWFS